jgi:hypothetical protein
MVFLRENYPFLNDEQWRAAERLHAVIGDESMNKFMAQPLTDLMVKLNKTINDFSSERKISSESNEGAKFLKLKTSGYGGNENENLPRWFVEIDVSIAARKIVDSRLQVSFMLSLLTGRAKEWALTRYMHDSNAFPNLDELKRQLINTFQPPKSEFRTRQRFLSVKQGKKTLHEYIQEVRALVADITDNPVDPHTQVSVFLGGLRHGTVRTQLFRAYPDTLEEAIVLSLEEEFSSRQSEWNGIIPSKFSNHKSKNDGPTPMEIGSMEERSTKKPVDLSKVRCYNCNNMGHVSRHCPKKKNNNSSNGSRFTKNGNHQ